MKGVMDNIAHIVYATDEHFAEIMGVSIISLFDNSRDMSDIIVYILDSGVSFENKKKVESVFETYHRPKPIWIPAKNISQELNMEIFVDRGSLGQYARLFVSSVLPEHLERVLYLDCDIIFNQSVRELWNLDMQGKTIAGLMDAFSRHYRANIGLKPNDIMFNSGVMLIDLNRWKNQKIEEKLLNFIANKGGKVQQGDQGALNAILSQDIFCFEPQYNSVTIFYDFTYEELMIYRKPPKFYTEEQVRKAIDKPVIIHFTTSFLSRRPWMEGCQHRYAEKWLEYKKVSPWKEAPLRKDNRAWWKQSAMKIYRKLPGKMGAYIAGVMQAYGRPIRNKMRGKKY